MEHKYNPGDIVSKEEPVYNKLGKLVRRLNILQARIMPFWISFDLFSVVDKWNKRNNLIGYKIVHYLNVGSYPK